MSSGLTRLLRNSQCKDFGPGKRKILDLRVVFWGRKQKKFRGGEKNSLWFRLSQMWDFSMGWPS